MQRALAVEVDREVGFRGGGARLDAKAHRGRQPQVADAVGLANGREVEDDRGVGVKPEDRVASGGVVDAVDPRVGLGVEQAEAHDVPREAARGRDVLQHDAGSDGELGLAGFASVRKEDAFHEARGIRLRQRDAVRREPVRLHVAVEAEFGRLHLTGL